VNDPVVNTFLAGMVTAGFVAGGLFFAKFWWRSGNVLFQAFAVSFWLLALNQALVTLGPYAEDTRIWFYLLRVAAFLLIAGAIVRNNTSSTGTE
jgi:Family of unknown function (DUF5985)